MRKFFSHPFFPYLIAWLAILWGLDLLARKYGLYYTFHYFDKVLHLIGGVSLGLFAGIALDSGASGRRSAAVRAIAMVGFALLFGGVWEVKEFVSNNLYGYAPFDAFDTTTDLICDTLGGLLSFIYLTYFQNYG